MQRPTLFGASEPSGLLSATDSLFTATSVRERSGKGSFFGTHLEVQRVSYAVQLCLSSGLFTLEGQELSPRRRNMALLRQPKPKGPGRAGRSRAGWPNVVPNTLKMFPFRLTESHVSLSAGRPKNNPQPLARTRDDTHPNRRRHTPHTTHHSAVQASGLPACVERSDQVRSGVVGAAVVPQAHLRKAGRATCVVHAELVRM